MVAKNGAPVRIAVVAMLSVVLAGCAVKEEPAAAPVVYNYGPQERIPYRPLPPGGASYVMEIPRIGPDGVRRTVNTDITDDEMVWHFRSGWNVAALNCSRDRHQQVVDAYSSYITDHSRALREVNKRLEQGYLKEAKTRRDGIKTREQQMTMVYNFFALPPARVNFCRAALDISNRASIAPIDDPIAFARDNFPVLIAPFQDFFTKYEEYERNSAEWDRKWGEQYGHSQPGWVAVQAHKRRVAEEEAAARMAQMQLQPGSTDAPLTVDPTTAMAGSGQLAAGAVIDPETGAAIPVVPVPENTVSIPVVEPVSNTGEKQTVEPNPPE